MRDAKNQASYSASRTESSSLPGLSYFRNRIYDQATGQWTQEDPIGLAGGLNLYRYAGGGIRSCSVIRSGCVQ